MSDTLRRVVLTFDNGPDDEVTPDVLNALRRADVRAIFFVVGSRITGRTEKHVRSAHGDGHLIGNHTWSHSRPLGDMSAQDAVDEIRRTGDLLHGLTGEPPLFRPVGGGEGGVIDRRLLNRESVDLLRRERYTLALWNVLPRDWIDPDGWVERALAACEQTDHACVVLHDIPGAARALLPSFLERLRDSGFAFVQDLPRSCTPIIGGWATGDLGALVSEGDSGTTGRGERDA